MPETLVTFFHEGSVRGFLHAPERPNGEALVLTHGAGGNCGGPLLVAIAEVFCREGMTVLRCDLPYRQRRPAGPPSIGTAPQDRAGLRDAVMLLRRTAGVVFLAGHSYGGRQASMLAAEQPDLVNGLILFSYPLHPPGKPAQPRTAHFPHLRTPTLFVHGERDPFGSWDELRSALSLIPARTALMPVPRAGHDLKAGRGEIERLIVPALRAVATPETTLR